MRACARLEGGQILGYRLTVMVGKPDYYWRKSKAQGYPARSVYKLEEIQSRFRIIRPGASVLDLGASPGSWSLFVMDSFGCRVTGVDLDKPDGKLFSRGTFNFIQGDFTDPGIAALIKDAGPFDVLLSDAAPSTSGNRTSDTARSLEICRAVLSKGGGMAVKIFQGGEEREILEEMKQLFAAARAFKPKASRSDSMEIYFVGTGFLGPSGA
jgi:23S rRNA (uridine2552-2'-O)-methyltransferase